MSIVHSSDGTPIAFERTGSGPPVVLMGGALNDQAALNPLAELLAAHFTVLNYDRRGRGASGMTHPYSIDREVDDLGLILAEAGEPAAVFANCSGGILAVEAATRGLPMTKLALYEPPYLEGMEATDHASVIAGLIAEDRRSEAVKYFLREVVDLEPEKMEKLLYGPAWPWLESLSPSLPYDVALTYKTRIPVEALATLQVPTLVYFGTRSPERMGQAAQRIADAVPNGRRYDLEGHNHNLIAETVAPLLIEFFEQ